MTLKLSFPILLFKQLLWLNIKKVTGSDFKKNCFIFKDPFTKDIKEYESL